MGTVKVKAFRPGGKPDDVIGYSGDERRWQGDVFEISDAPKMRSISGPAGEDIEVPIPGSIAAFSDGKRKKSPGWMVFVDPADEAKYRKGGFNPAGAAEVKVPVPAPSGAPAPAGGKPEDKTKGKTSTGDKSVLE